MTALLQHVAECRLGARDPAQLIVGEGKDVRDRFAIRQLVDAGAESGLNNAAEEIGRRGFEANRLHRPEFRDVDGVVEAVLDIAVERRHKAVP
jgi:hypothetical protein